MVAQPDVFFGNPLKPAGGNVIAHGATYRVWLRKGKENVRIAKIFDSPYHLRGRLRLGSLRRVSLIKNQSPPNTDLSAHVILHD